MSRTGTTILWFLCLFVIVAFFLYLRQNEFLIQKLRELSPYIRII